MSAKVTSVTTTMSETDLMENIREFVEVEGLTIHNVEFKNNSIEVTGNFKKVIDIPFFASVHVASVADNVIRIKLEKIKVLKVGLPNALLAAALSFAMKKVENIGVTYEDGHIIADVDELLKQQPHVHVSLDNVIMENGLLAIKVSNIQADVKAIQAEAEQNEIARTEAEAQAEVEEAIAEEELKNFNINLANVKPTEDEYARLRRDLDRRVPLNRQQVFEWASALPDIMALAVRVIRDKRVLMKDKVIIGASMGYFLSPIDLVPERIPVLNKLDDAAFFIFGVNHMMNRLPMPIIVEHWAGDLKTLKLIKDNIGMIMTPVGSSNIDRIYSLADDKIDERFGDYLDDDFYFKDPVAPLSIHPVPHAGPEAPSAFHPRAESEEEPPFEPVGETPFEEGSGSVDRPISRQGTDPALIPSNAALGEATAKPADVPVDDPDNPL